MEGVDYWPEETPYSVGGMSTANKSEEDGDSFSSKVINIVFIILLLDLLGFTLILPLLPSILDHYAQTGDVVYQSLQSVVDWFREAVGIPMEKKYNSVLFGGLIGSLFSLLQFLASPVTGALSDRHGRRPLLILTTLGLMTSYAVWAVSWSFSMFLLFRVIGGICKGNVSLCTAIVADLPSPKARNRGMAMIGVAFSLGFTVGPLMGAYFALSSRTAGNVFYQTPALLALAFSIADLLFIWLKLPETLTKDVKALPSGFGDSWDLLNPLSLFHFSTVAKTKDPPSKKRRSFYRNAKASNVGPGLFLLPLPVLWSGVYPEFSDSPALPVYKYAARKDVLLHWCHHGIDPGRLRSQNQTWAPSQGCSYGDHSIDPSIYSHWVIMECNDALPWPGVVLLCGRHSCSMLVNACF
uniref:major facilitator superfamily domain-containing protein 10 isoform X4 n=1 Tax=Monopterus albus TaxID=43700 RepID=UPI0009B358B4|nr:major facilitator superfamily domain-containing protein 10 isoform X4 [Monopterus albus]